MAIVMKLTKDWQVFTGDYQKEMQDIELHDGTVFTMCWPNAGKFHVMSCMGKQPVLYKDVKRVRACDDPF